jgi:hypothetical protein
MPFKVKIKMQKAKIHIKNKKGWDLCHREHEDFGHRGHRDINNPKFETNPNDQNPKPKT